MFGIFKKKNQNKPAEKDEAEQVSAEGLNEPQWYEAGVGNPFNERILDIRTITLNMMATTKEKWISENFTQSRSDNGEKYTDSEIDEATAFPCDIHYPHNGATLEGVVFKSDSMDVKWDIYAYGAWFYFVRSWTSELVYKVHYQNMGNELIFDRIVTANPGSGELHAQNIHSMMLTHVLGRVWPYRIPDELKGKNETDIALYLFTQFGCKATLATDANILKIQLEKR
ncbi:hypothetical protein VA7868_04426 [Vibrio aerogenes CECT 7868]|uniref:Uncharacterized protein n=1 Tax=Vibrio aerogenes CECT 7868 TaxID=1216006 RepID=A0A1M6ECE6_9VIBR|nr:hypothetical protein [Vibrio aerogenes]SHI83111.1 hypothetical protein VA7868_04426 [Vibrio aerogenes CECT 7868]